MTAGPECIVVMGVAGSGKTTVGRELAAYLQFAFLDADDLHSASSVAKMRAGVPLDDADRAGWLVRVRDWIRTQHDAGEQTVVACSALRRRYRARLLEAGDYVRFCHVVVPPEVLAERLAGRTGHFLPASLLASQLAQAEPIGTDEPAVAVDGDAPRDVVLGRVLVALGLEEDR